MFKLQRPALQPMVLIQNRTVMVCFVAWQLTLFILLRVVFNDVYMLHNGLEKSNFST